MKSENYLHRGFQDNFSHQSKLENYASKMKNVLSQEQVSCWRHEPCDHEVSEDCGYIVNTIPAHVRQNHPMDFHQQQHPHYQTMPNSPSVKDMREVPMYGRVEPPRSFHGHPSCVQSSPRQCQPFHGSGFSSNQHRQQMSSSFSGLSSICSLNGSICNWNGSSSGANSGDCSTSFCSHHSMNSSTAEDDADQPINYSLKDQDVCSRDRGNTSSSSGNTQVPYGYQAASVVGGLNFRPRMVPENLRPAVIEEYNSLLNNSAVCDRLAANVTGSGTLRSSASASTMHRPAPNPVHNRCHTPHGYQSVGVPHHHPPPSPRFMTPQEPYSNASFHPRGHLYPSGHSTHNPRSILLSNVVVSPSGYSSGNKLPNTGANQIHTLQTAHKNASHPVQQFKSAYAEADLETVVDQLTNFSLRYNEVLEDNCCEICQKKLVNYPVRSHDSRGREVQDVGAHRDKRHCVDCMYAEARRINDVSNDDQVKVFCTEDSPELSTASSLIDMTKAGIAEREEKPVDGSKQMKSTIEMDRATSRTHVIAAAIGSRSPTVISACKGQELGAVSSKCTSQLADERMIQQNFYSYVDFNEGAIDQTKTYREEGTPICFSRVSSYGTLHCSEPREDGDLAKQNNITDKMQLTCFGEADTPRLLNKSVMDDSRAACPTFKSATNLRGTNTEHVLKGNSEFETAACDENNQVEDSPLVFSRCSSPESLSSFDIRSVHSSVASECSSKASETVSPSEIPGSPSEPIPPGPRQIHSTARQFADLPLNPDSTDVIAKRSLHFEKTSSTVTAESFGNVSACDEDKTINFTRRNPEVPVVHMCSDSDQLMEFSSMQREREESHLISSTFQKNIQPANRNLNVHLVTSRAKVMPTIEEQDLETASAPGVLAEYAEEGTPHRFSETTSVSGITISSSSSRGAVSKYSNLQHQLRDPGLSKVQEKESGPQIDDSQEAPPVFSVGGENAPLKDTVWLEDRDTAVSDKDRDTAVSDKDRDTAVSDKDRDTAVSDKDRDTAVSDKDRDTAISHKDSDTAVSNKDKDTSVSDKDKDTSIFNKDKDTSIFNKDKVTSVSVKDRVTAISDKDMNTSASNKDSDSSMSDVSQEEEDILAECINSGMPSPVSSCKTKCKTKEGTPLNTSSDARMKHPQKISSILKNSPKNLASFFKSPADHVKGHNRSVENEDLSQMREPDMGKSAPKNLASFFKSPADHVKGHNRSVENEDMSQNEALSQMRRPDMGKRKTGSKLAEHNRDVGDRRRASRKDGDLSSASCSSAIPPIPQLGEKLKQIGGNIESPESRVRQGVVFELCSESSLLEQAYFQSAPLQPCSGL